MKKSEKEEEPPSGKLNKTVSLGVFLIFVGMSLLLSRSLLMDFIVSSMMVLKPGGVVTSSWLKMPFQLPTDIFFFNWTNPEDFYDESVKPRFVEVGPYRFLQHMEKVNVVWNDNDTVTFNQLRYWHFDDNFIGGALEDNITSINAITLGSSHLMRNWNYAIKRAASVLLSAIAPKIETTRTVNQLLFEGYEDLIVDIARYLPFIASQVPRFDRFGWFRIINGSETFEGVYNMANKGSFDVLEWNYQNTTPYFEGECSKVYGSAGELYQSKPPKTHIEIFLSHLCRHLKFEFEEEIVVDGILGYKYSIRDAVLDNGTKIPGNECYCSGDCLPSGMINVSSCRYGSPTYVSLPQFYYSDPVYGNAVEGFAPEKSKHETYIVLEPTTGVPLEAVVRLQLNNLVQPVEGISLFENVRKLYFPLFWVQQRANLPSDSLLTLKILLAFPYVFLGVSTILVAVGLYLTIGQYLRNSFVAVCSLRCSRHRKKNEKQKQEVIIRDLCSI